jgi:polyphosphate kinase
MPNQFLCRELSWLDFNERVLEEALDRASPSLERLKFLAITASNLDEFFMVRVAGLHQQATAGYQSPDPAGLTPHQQLARISEKTHDFTARQYSCFARSLMPALKKNGVSLVRPEAMNEEQRRYAAAYFDQVVHPVLTPLAVDASRPFPFLSNRTLNLAVRMRKKEQDCFAIIQVPSILPRFLRLPCGETAVFLALEDLIADKMPHIFSAYKLAAIAPFRLTRNADLNIDEETDDLLREIEDSIRRRRLGGLVRLEIPVSMDDRLRSFLCDALSIRLPEDKNLIYECKGPLDLAGFMRFCHEPEFDRLRIPSVRSRPSEELPEDQDLFALIRQRDRLLHVPFESFDPVVRFLHRAAEDPGVLAIKQTLYRVSGQSPVINALIRAAENGKQVTAVVELKARFDEENNIQWARRMEQAGCHVVYGLAGIKVHAKMLLVVRREDGGIRRYVHLSTGNYNETTARLYTDISLFTAREDFGADVSSLFNALTGYAAAQDYRKLITAPDHMREFWYQQINDEVENHKSGFPSGITVKINSLLDPHIIARLYAASRAGVPVRLIVRGICCLLPGVPGMSDTISVRSIVGQLLEHSRVFCFENKGRPLLYLSSADLMQRNLDRRVEIVFPVEEEALRERLIGILDIYMRDNLKARIMQPDGTYARAAAQGKPVSAQEMLRG